MSKKYLSYAASLDENEFYNRTEDIKFISDIFDGAEYGASPTILLTGIRRVGKTALIKQLEKIYKNKYFISYIDLTQSNEYQTKKLTRQDIIKKIYDSLIEGCSNSNISSSKYKIEKIFKTNDFGIDSRTQFNDIPVPLLEKEENYSKFVNYVMDLPTKIIDNHSNKIKGAIIFMDEIQALKDLGDDLKGFLWYLRSKIQFQKNVIYVFTGSMGTKDDLIEYFNGQDGAFGGRILTIQINPFSSKTTINYLKDKLPELKLSDEAYNQFYKCTQGIPYYINLFANLLPKNVELNEKDIEYLFKKYVKTMVGHYLVQWGKLTFQEQKILTSLVDMPLKRIDIAKNINTSSGAIGKSLNHLLDLTLIEYDNGKYKIIDPILKSWLKVVYDEKGIYPYREYID